jgi:nucleotide-binding universal stress UspA family protein
MSYRTITVALDPGRHCGKRVQFAIRLAKKFDCRLVGVAAADYVDLATSSRTAAALAELAETSLASLRHQAAQAAGSFRHECSAAGLSSFEALVDVSKRAEAIVRHAHCSDLTVLTQADPSDPDYADNRAFVDDVVLKSPRPTLVLPYAGRVDTVGTHVTVAWDGSREASRAIADALPLLQRAEHVEVATWQNGARLEAAERHQVNAFCRWLIGHGVEAHPLVEHSAVPIADALLSHAADRGTDLIVMGAYGHARWAERLFGGATRELLTSMTSPILMSH